MQAVQELAAYAKNHGLFRAASACDVTCSLLSSMLPCESCQSAGSIAGSSSRFQFLRKVSTVELFVSHSSKCASWQKLLALCHYLNVDLAIFSSFLACILGVIFLVVRAGSLSAVAQKPQSLLSGSLYWGPVLVFASTYACGQVLSNKLLWFDRLCIDQENLLRRCQALTAVPAFVAQSERMLILLDETYFSRLWCIYELAVHSKTGSATAELIPIWMPLWTICFISFSSMAWAIFEFLDSGEIGPANASPQLDTESIGSLFVSVVKTNLFPPALYLFYAVPAAWFCFQKLKRHKRMLDQMAEFQLGNAKCTLETDRRVIEEQVLNLFDEALEPPIRVAFGTDDEEDMGGSETLLAPEAPETIRDIRHITSYPTSDQIIDQFNAYVRGPLRDSVIQSLGKEDYIPFRLCTVAGLPWILWNVRYLLGCGADCRKSASSDGFSSVSQYFVFDAIYYLFISPLSIFVEFPSLLIACRWASDLVEHSGLRLFFGTGLCSIVMYFEDRFLLLQCGVLAAAVAKFSPLWLAASLLSVILDLGLLWFLFFRKQLHPTQRTLV
eukprot:s376_g10.t1